MKKALLFFAVVAFAFTANAQVVLSGNLTINTSAYGESFDGKTYETDFSNVDHFGFVFNPKVGYQINNKFIVGAYLGYAYDGYVAYTPQADPSKIATETTDNEGAFSFGLFGRMNFCTLGSFSFFGELSTGFAVGVTQTVINNKVSGVETKLPEHDFFNFKIQVIPGFNYAFNEHFSADLYLNIIGLRFATSAESYKNAADKEIVKADAHFGLACDLMGNTLHDYMSAITIGVNYKF